MSKRILIIEDEPGLLITIEDRLISEGYTVKKAIDGEEGLKLAKSESFDLILLDIMLPKKNGFDVCRDLRLNGFFTPILMLTARGQVTDKVVGLKLGADDYLTKPFEMLELLARIEALLRRIPDFTKTIDLNSYTFNKIQIDFQKAEVIRDEKVVDLSAQEFRLLAYFVNNKGKILSRQELLDDVWGYDSTPTTRTVDVHVSWLRQKLEENPKHPRYILTVHKFGYKFSDRID